MNRHLTSMMVAVLAAAAVHISAPASAGHRPGNVVVIGGTLALTGRYALPAQRYFNGFKLFVERLNARGGLLGHRIELKILDDKSDKRTAIELYEELIVENKIDLVLAPYSSSITDAVANVMERYRRPYLSYGSNPVIYQRGRRYTFGATTSGTDRHKGTLHVAKKMGINKVAIVSQANLYARGQLTGTLKWAKELGLNVVLLERYRVKQKDFRPLLRRIETSGAEAIFAATFYQDAVALIRQLRELNINVKIFAATTGPALPDFVKELGSTAEFVLGFTSWEPKPHLLGHPGAKEFVEYYEKRYGEKPNYHAASGYSNLQIFTAAVHKASSFNQEDIRDVLASIRVDGTIRGSWKANEQGWGTFTGLTFQIQNGERVIVWPAHKSEARFLLMPKWEDRAKK